MPIIRTALTLKDLPPPLPEQSGWPWTQQSQPLPARMPERSEWPLISIVTPSYNQGQFIEETIRSVLLQGYPNLEFIIIDGGSSDNSVEIIQKYEPWLTYWVSEPDKGQTDAIQKGFNLSTGVLVNWLNSDDVLEANALQKIALAYQNHPSATMYSGDLTVFGQGEPFLYTKCFQTLSELVCVWEKWAVPQPAVFLSRKAWLAVNGLNTSLHYGMDYELYLRLAQLPGFNVYNIDAPVARIRRHSESKTSSQQIAFRREILEVFDNFAKNHPSLLPQGWRRSRELFEYISAITFAQYPNNKEISELSLFSFIKLSMPYFLSICRYRFFWGVLRQKIQRFSGE
jgi:glycosyltransferase involved in cell wall biosynthesis